MYTVACVDDVTLVCSDKICTVLTHMQSLLDTCYVWASSHRLKLDISKCFALYVPAATHAKLRDDLHLSQLAINASPMSWVHEMKILGANFTTTLSWSNHANNVRSKISRVSGILQRFGCALDGLTGQRIFQEFIQPRDIVLFYLPVWGNLVPAQCHLLDSCLLRCADQIQCNCKVVFSQDTFNTTGILPVHL